MKSKNYVLAITGLAILLGAFFLSVPKAGHAQARHPQQVTIENLPDRPVPVTFPDRVRVCLDEDCPAATLNANDRTAFQRRVQFEIPSGQPVGGVTIPVPVGKRFVIEFVSARQDLLLAFQQSGGLFLRTELNNQEGSFSLPLTKQATVAGTDYSLWIAAQQLRVYADAPGFRVEVGRTPAGGDSGVDVSVSGYLVDL
jgi:hypothetical protein